MRKHSKNTKTSIDKFIEIMYSPPSKEEKKWGILNDFYHMVLTYMDERNIKRKDLADSLGVSKSRVSQLLNHNPNLSVDKMVEIAEAVGINLRITSDEVDILKEMYTEVKPVVIVIADTEHTQTIHSEIGQYQFYDRRQQYTRVKQPSKKICRTRNWSMA